MIPPAFYQGVGQVAVEVARLECLLAEMVAIITDQGDAYVDTIIDAWWKIKKDYKAAVAGVTDDEQLKADLTRLLTDVEVVRTERHKLAHTVIALDRQEGWSEEPLWVTYWPRTPDAEPQPLPSPADFADLIRRIGGLTGRTLKLRVRVIQRFPTPRHTQSEHAHGSVARHCAPRSSPPLRSRSSCLTRGMDERELAGLRTTLLDFADDVFAGFARADQRANGVRYLRGLMLDGRRTSMQPMGERLGVDHQQLQQFMTTSTWDYVAVRRRLAGKVLDVVDPVAWVIDDTGFAKDGTASPGVARQYSGTLGKVGNCQVAVSLHAVTDAASGVLNWRLFLPESWDEDRLPAVPDGPQHEDERAQREQKAAAIKDRRSRAKIPDDERNRAKWLQALEMIDELADWEHTPPLVVADAGYGQIGAFRQGLSDRDISYVLATTAPTSAHPAQAVPLHHAYSGRGRPPTGVPAYPDRAPTLKELALQAGPATAEKVLWRNGTRTSPDNPTAQMSGHFFTLRVRPAGRGTPTDEHGVLPERWLLIEWPPEASEPTDYWLAVRSTRRHPDPYPRLAGEDPLAHRTRLPRTQNRPRTRPFRRPDLHRLAPPRHPRHRRPALPHHPATTNPKSRWADLSLYAILRELQYLVATWDGFCPRCHQLVPT